MQLRYITILIIFSLLTACGSKTNSPEFMERVSGRYLMNADEAVTIYFENDELFMKWRGADNLKPMALGDETFFVKEMNQKITFRQNPEDGQYYLCMIPKEKDSIMKFDAPRMATDQKTPSELLDEGKFEKAKQALIALKQLDSTNFLIEEAYLNRYGYNELRKENYDKSIAIFEANVAMYPESSNVYDSLGEAFMKRGDTVRAITNYSRSLELDSGNRRAKNMLKRLRKEDNE